MKIVMLTIFGAAIAVPTTQKYEFEVERKKEASTLSEMLNVIDAFYIEKTAGPIAAMKTEMGSVENQGRRRSRRSVRSNHRYLVEMNMRWRTNMILFRQAIERLGQ